MKKVRILPRASIPPPTCCRRQDDAVATPPAFANRPLSAKQTPHGRARPSPPRPPATTAADAAATAAVARRGGRNSGPQSRSGGQCQVAGRRGKPFSRRVGRAPPPALRRRGARRRAGARRARPLGGGRRVGVRLASGLVGLQRAVAHPPGGGGSPPADAPQMRGRERQRACLSPTRWRRRSASRTAARVAHRPNRPSNRCGCGHRWRLSVPPPNASAVATATSVARRRTSG